MTGDAPPVVAGALLLDAAGRVIGRSGPDSGWVPGVGPGPVTLGERFEPLNPLSAAAAQALSAGLARVLSGQVPSYRQVWQEPGWAGSVQVDRWEGLPGALVSWVDGGAGEPLRALFDHFEQAVLLIDREWRLTYLNPAAQRYVRPEVTTRPLGSVLWEVFPRLLAAGVEGDLRRAMADGRPFRRDVHLAAVDQWFEVSVHAHREGLQVSFVDVTARRWAQQGQQAHTEVLEAALRGVPLGELLDTVARNLEAACPGYLSLVMLVDAADGRLRAAAAPGLPASVWPSLDVPVRVGEGACGTAAALNRQVVLTDMFNDPSCAVYRDLVVGHDLRAVVSWPLHDRAGRVTGTLALFARQPGAFPTLVLETLERTRHAAAMVVSHARALETLAHQATLDVVTGAANRVRLEQVLAGRLQSGPFPLGVLAVNTGNLEAISEQLGHDAGDLLLGETARRLAARCGAQELLAKLSAGQFIVVLPGVGREEARARAQVLADAVRAPLTVKGRRLSLSPKVGLHVVGGAGEPLSAAQCVQYADLALRSLRPGGPDVAVFEPGLLESSRQRFEIATALRDALTEGQLSLHYQPKVRLDSGELSGVEALLRWRHPELGNVRPDVFIPVAEDTGLITRIGAWVLREACRQAATWRAAAYPSLQVAVNVSAVQFAQADFVGVVGAALREAGLPPAALELEVTESVVMQGTDRVLGQLRALRDLGVSVSIDDFGTGYSSLSYLPSLPVSALKIDRAFVTPARPGSGAAAVLEAITAVAQQLGLETVAEGVETAEQYQLVRSLGCQYAQGYLFGRPRPAHEGLGLSFTPPGGVGAARAVPGAAYQRVLEQLLPCQSQEDFRSRLAGSVGALRTELVQVDPHDPLGVTWQGGPEHEGFGAFRAFQANVAHIASTVVNLDQHRHLYRLAGQVTGAGQRGEPLSSVALAFCQLFHARGLMGLRVRRGQLVRERAWDAGTPAERTFSAGDLRRVRAGEVLIEPDGALVPVAGKFTARVALWLSLPGAAWNASELGLLRQASFLLGAEYERVQAERYRQAVLDVHRELLSCPVEEAYRLLLTKAIELTPGAESGSFLVRVDGQFRYAASAGYAEQELRDVRFDVAAVRDAWYGRGVDAWNAGLPRVVREGVLTAQGSGYFRGEQWTPETLPSLQGITANIGAPILYAGEVYGFLNIDSASDADAFAEDSLEVVRAFAAQAALLLHEANLREQIHLAARTDLLTGLPNRRAFTETLEREVSRARRHGEPLSLIVADIRRFKSVNDQLGHPAGDEALTLVARVVRATVRTEDTVFRWGGDEFALLLPRTDAAAAVLVRERLRAALRAAPFTLGPLELNMGIATLAGGQGSGEQLLHEADAAMYREKRGA
ncbi:EAL domain-containing protein [Deinococcus sp. LM3]|uniref:bifunctional diguanylate cyclase/phosphodiesterase n=1 Tax=Deinococcus sp. LM3 TaxID=1938608 RepID=UPI00117F4B6F|nr:EAL domain-containing protein [Deinococcus sp. LM3]